MKKSDRISKRLVTYDEIWKTGKMKTNCDLKIAIAEKKLIDIEGKAVSETIIKERR